MTLAVVVDDRGQGLAEYVLIIGLVAATVTGVLIALSGVVNGLLGSAATAV
jgi:Flp pilus assembly pilin Flp